MPLTDGLWIYTGAGTYRVYDHETDTWDAVSAPWDRVGSIGPGSSFQSGGGIAEMLLAGDGQSRLWYYTPTSDIWRSAKYKFGNSYGFMGAQSNPPSGKPTAYFGMTGNTYVRVELQAGDTVVSTEETLTGWPSGNLGSQRLQTNCLSSDGYFQVMTDTNGDVFQRHPDTGVWSNIGHGNILRPDDTNDGLFYTMIAFAHDDILVIGRHFATTHWNGSTWTDTKGTWWWAAAYAAPWVYDRNLFYFAWKSGTNHRVAKWVNDQHYRTENIVGPWTATGLEKAIGRSPTDILYFQNSVQVAGDGKGLWHIDTSVEPWIVTDRADPPNDFNLNTVAVGFWVSSYVPSYPVIELISHNENDTVKKFGPIVIDATMTGLVTLTADLLELEVKIDGKLVPVFDTVSQTFAEGWKASSLKEIVDGFRFTIVPGSVATWRDSESIELIASITGDEPLSETFNLVGKPRPYETRIQNMVVLSMREGDE